MNISLLAGYIPDFVIQALTPDFLVKAKIDGPKRLSHFLGQCMEESGNFTVFTENLNYSANGLAKKWPGRYSTHGDKIEPNALAMKLQHDPEAIANNCYCNRNGNGTEASRDGWAYRGRGPIQLTGKAAYKGFQEWYNDGSESSIDLLSNPNIVATDINIGLLSAAWIFKSKNLWPICDVSVDTNEIISITKKINGGLTHLESRINHTHRIYTALTT